MYPTLYDFFYDIFSIKIHAFRFVNTFGFFMAIAFFAAFQMTKVELGWRERRGIFLPIEVKRMVGEKAKIHHYIIHFILGFLFGYKIIGIFFSSVVNSQEYVFSLDGSWLGGILFGVAFSYASYSAKKKEELPKPVEKTIRLLPHDLADNGLLICLVAGILGAKIFHNLENIDELIARPIDSLFSFSGLTFYGGLICAFLAIWIYVRKYKIDFLYFADAVCVGVLLAYGIGRFGCHFAGDGDWGMYNKSPNPLPFLPDWWWAYSYPNNVLGVKLPYPVFPTPLYEAVVCILLAFILRSAAKKINVRGVTLGIYFIIIGVERFAVELIRINIRYHIGSFYFTQAELISCLSILLGIGLIVYCRKKYKLPPTTSNV